jgi:hypothetical protein
MVGEFVAHFEAPVWRLSTPPFHALFGCYHRESRLAMLSPGQLWFVWL